MKTRYTLREGAWNGLPSGSIGEWNIYLHRMSRKSGSDQVEIQAVNSDYGLWLPVAYRINEDDITVDLDDNVIMNHILMWLTNDYLQKVFTLGIDEDSLMVKSIRYSVHIAVLNGTIKSE